MTMLITHSSILIATLACCWIPVSDVGLQKAVYSAVQKGGVRALRRQLHMGAEVNAHYADGETLLMRAVADGRLTIVKILLENGADVNHHDSFGYSPLMIASSTSSSEVVRLLILKGARINDPNQGIRSWDRGSTALHCAARLGKTTIVRLFIMRGANVNIRNALGQTAFSIALTKATASVLRSAGGKK